MLFLLSHREKDQTRRCPGCGSAGVPGEPAGWAALLPHRQLLLHRDHQVTKWPSQPQHSPARPQPPPRVCCLPCCCPHPLPTVSLGPLEVSEIPNFQSSFSIFSIYVGIFNGSWPEKVQHLPHTDIGPFPVLGISVLCWSNSDSNFKMFSAAISWQDSTSLPIPWLIRGG